MEDFEPDEVIMSFWAIPSIACTQDLEISEIDELYGRLGDADSEVAEDVIQPTTVFEAIQQPKKNTPIPSGGFQYDVDATLAASKKDGIMHDWVLCELRSFAAGMVCLFKGTRQTDVLARVVSHARCNPVSIYYSILCTPLRLITKLVGVKNLKLLRVGVHVFAMDYNPGVQLIHMFMPVEGSTAIPQSN